MKTLITIGQVAIGIIAYPLLGTLALLGITVNQIHLLVHNHQYKKWVTETLKQPERAIDASTYPRRSDLRLLLEEKPQEQKLIFHQKEADGGENLRRLVHGQIDQWTREGRFVFDVDLARHPSDIFLPQGSPLSLGSAVSPARLLSSPDRFQVGGSPVVLHPPGDETGQKTKTYEKASSPINLPRVDTPLPYTTAQGGHVPPRILTQEGVLAYNVGATPSAHASGVVGYQGGHPVYDVKRAFPRGVVEPVCQTSARLSPVKLAFTVDVLAPQETAEVPAVAMAASLSQRDSVPAEEVELASEKVDGEVGGGKVPSPRSAGEDHKPFLEQGDEGTEIMGSDPAQLSSSIHEPAQDKALQEPSSPHTFHNEVGVMHVKNQYLGHVSSDEETTSWEHVGDAH